MKLLNLFVFSLCGSLLGILLRDKKWLQITFCIITAIILSLIFVVINTYAEVTGEVSASYVSASGNTSAHTLNTSLKVKRITESHEIEALLEVLYDQKSGITKTQYYKLALKDSHYLEADYGPYWYNRHEYARNEHAGIKTKLTTTLGGGYCYQHDAVTLKLEAGPGWLYEERIPMEELFDSFGRVYAEGIYVFTEKANLTADSEYIYPISESDNYRLSGNTYLDVGINDRLKLRTGITLEYVNMPPDNVEHTDFYTKTALVVGF